MKSFTKVTMLMSTIIFVGCGQNAHLNKATSKSLKAIKTIANEKLEITDISMALKDINLGNISKGQLKLVPIVLRNSGKSNITKVELLSKDDGIKLPSAGEIVLTPGTSMTFLAEVNESIIGEICKEIKVSYSSKDLSKEAFIKLSGNVVDNDSLVSSNLEISREEDKEIQFDKIPSKSKATQEVLLKNMGLTASSIISVELLKGKNFSLSQKSIDNCVGQVLDNCSVESSFVPQTEGVFTDSIKITYINAKNERKIKSISLSGEATNENKCLDISEVALLPIKEKDITSKQLSIEFPYHGKVNGSSILIEKLINEGSNKFQSTLEGSVYYVSDAQVLTLFNVDSKRKDGDIINVELNVDMKKILSSNPNYAYERTEVLCVENSMICSGVRFFDSKFSKFVNTNYLLDGDHFAKNLIDNGKRIKEAGIPFLKYSNTLGFDKIYPRTSGDIYKDLEVDSFAKVIFSDDIKLENMHN